MGYIHPNEDNTFTEYDEDINNGHKKKDLLEVVAPGPTVETTFEPTPDE
jgi:hypothetical protein